MGLAALLVGVALVVYLAMRSSGSPPREGSQGSPAIVIAAPTLGILNLAGEDARSVMEADRRAFGGTFSRVTEATGSYS